MAIRRVAEVGDGSYEQMIQKNASVNEEPLQAAQRRKKRYSTAALKEAPKQENSWEQLAGALRTSQKSFKPESIEDLQNGRYSSYDTSGRSVRRYESDEIEEESIFDPRTAASFHMYDDPGAQIEEWLKESMAGHLTIAEQTEMRELKKIEDKDAWDAEYDAWAAKRLHNRNGEAISGSDIRGSITRTANERIAASNFGQTDYGAVADREEQRLQMIENMRAKNKSIRDSRLDISKADRNSQWDNLDNARSKSVQAKANTSKLFSKLAQLVDE